MCSTNVGGPIGVGPYAGKRQEASPNGSRRSSRRRAAEHGGQAGGLAMHLSWFRISRTREAALSAELARLETVYRHLHQAFGPTRSMFESNFPVDKGMCS